MMHSKIRYISADYIYPVTGQPLKNGIVVTDESGRIQEIIETGGKVREMPLLEHYNGVIIPGLVNSHCHLELSYMKGKITPRKGLDGFINEFVHLRNTYNNDPSEIIELADKRMAEAGIAVIGDISNGNSSFAVKKKSSIYYHTFVEVSDLFKFDASVLIEKASKLIKEIEADTCGSSSVVPHAPYSVSPLLFQAIGKLAYENDQVISVHNQESDSENELFLRKEGRLMNVLQLMGTDFSSFQATGKSSLISCLPYLPASVNILLVHNTFTIKEDIDFASAYSDNIYWVLCPNANIYIENKLPDVVMFQKNKMRILIGTDSYASNISLSVLEEMKTIRRNFPAIQFQDLLEWATINGANALNISTSYGSLEPGKAPGINLIDNFDFSKMNIADNSRIRVLVKPRLEGKDG